jgi:hypothetical protein
MKLIPLTRGKFAKVSDCDYEYLNQWKWTYHSQGYAYRQIRRKDHVETILMHRLITFASKGLEVDHRDRDRLNNQRENLLVVTRSANSYNKPTSRRNTTGHTGVYFDKRRSQYQAYISVEGKKKHLGWYKEIEDAIKARKWGENEYHGFSNSSEG